MADLGKAGATAEGTYNPESTYERVTFVRYEGALWLSKKDVPAGNAPAESGEYWMLAARDGKSVSAGDGIEVTDNSDGTQTVSYTGVKTIISETAPNETENVLWVKPGTD